MFLTAKKMFRGIPTAGKVVLWSKGGLDYGKDAFAFRICDDGERYHIMVLSAVAPYQDSVLHSDYVTVDRLVQAILEHELNARELASGAKLRSDSYSE